MIAEKTTSTCGDFVVIKSITWLKDSHSLFDYDCVKNTVKNETKVPLIPSTYVFLYRNNATSEVFFRQKREMVPPIEAGTRLLGCFQIVKNKSSPHIQAEHQSDIQKHGNTFMNSEGKYTLKFSEPQQFESQGLAIDKLLSENSVDSPHDNNRNKEQKISLIVRSLKDHQNQQKGLQLKSGQSVKFGRVEYKVAVIHEGENHDEYQCFENEKELQVEEDEVYEEGTACRICLMSDQGQSDFLCHPCNCTGSISIAHFQCLAQWSEFKVKKNNSGLLTEYNLDKFECQICKKQLPRYISHKGVKHDLLPIEKPETTYLILSCNGPTEQIEKTKKLVMYKYEEGTQVNVGRNNLSALRLADLSVSRNHAKIQAKNGEFFIFDSRSKFGTLMTQPNLSLELSTIKKGVQIGRSIFIFQFVHSAIDSTVHSTMDKE